MTNLNNKITAVIMVGGESKRMGGGIKSLMTFNNKSIFERILERLEPQVNKIIINCNQNEKSFAKYRLPILKDLKQGYFGPLAGIHTSMRWLSINDPLSEWLITMPGDTPFIPLDIIAKFKNKMSKQTKIILAQSGMKIHPIIGAWHTSLFESLDIYIENGIRKILTWANNHPIEYVNFNKDPYDPFFNINYKEDLIEAKQIEELYFF